MALWSQIRERPRVVAVVVVALAVVVVAIVLLTRADDSISGATPLQQVLREIDEDGNWSEETALRAFSAVFGPMPGVVVPDGPSAEVEFGTIAIRMLSRYIDEIEPAQREAALELAGPLARFLDPRAPTTGRLPEGEPTMLAMGIPGPDVPVAADADDYEAEISSIVTTIESEIQRPLGIDVSVVVSPTPVGILHATAGPLTSDGEQITGCEVTILPNAQALSGKNLTAVLAHETWHCFEFSRLGTMSRRKSSPPWIIEGQAMWVGEAVVGGTQGLEPTVRHWNEYLIDPGPTTGLFARSYDAIGFYSHLHDQGIEPWAVFDSMLDQTSNLAAFDKAVGGQSLDVVTTWAPSWYRDGSPTSTFALIKAPGILDTSVRPPPDTFTISNGTFQQVSALKPLSAGLADVAVASEILVIDVIGQAIVGDMMFGEEIRFVANSRTFCMVADCTCPDGSPGPADHLGEELRVGVTGDALNGSDALLRGWSIDEWCQGENEDPPEPGDGSPPGTPCEEGCASSNGDPHLTTVDGSSYDFQAAGEFVLLRSETVEVQARQEPYAGSDSVTINTGMAVASDGGRVAVYVGPQGPVLYLDGVETELTGSVASGGLEVSAEPDGFRIEAGDGTVVWALGIGEWGLNVLVSASPSLETEGVGLLAATGDDFFPALPDGSRVDPADVRQALYVDLAGAWAVSEDDSLFDYEEGSGPADFRDESIPEPGSPIDFSELDEVLQELGLEACSSIGDAGLLEQCAFDVAVTNDSGFVSSYESTDVFLVTVEEEPGSISGGLAVPLLEDVALVAGSALDAGGMLYLSVRFEDQHSELVAVDPAGQNVVGRLETEKAGQIVFAADSVWMSTTRASDCVLDRFDTSLQPVAAIELDCSIGFFAPQVVAAGDRPWVYLDGPGLARVDPEVNTLGEAIDLPFANGYLRSTGETIFYSDLEEGIHVLAPGAGELERFPGGHILVHPAGTGFWEQADDSIVHYPAPDASPTTIATDGTLVGAIEGAALVEHRVTGGSELWAYPADRSEPRLLTVSPLIGAGSEERALDYFDDNPPMSSTDLVVKVWQEYPRTGDEAAVVFVQAIPLR